MRNAAPPGVGDPQRQEWVRQLCSFHKCGAEGSHCKVAGIEVKSPVFLLGKSHGQRSLVCHSPWGCKQSDTTECCSALSSALMAQWFGGKNTVYEFPFLPSFIPPSFPLFPSSFLPPSFLPPFSLNWSTVDLNITLVSGVRQGDSVTHTHAFQIIFHYRLFQNIE